MRKNGKKKTGSGGRAPAVDRAGLEKVVVLLRGMTGRDFSLYKKSTLARRVERRLAVLELGGLGEYLSLLQSDAAEAELLLKDLLIGVTRFFREPEVWERLGKKVLPALLAGRPDGGVLRAWVPACSTGEEPYSLAMVLREAVDRQGPANKYTVQIFATDLDADAVARARTGLYPPRIAQDVPAARLKKFFTRERAGWRVNKEIRSLVTFAAHDITSDPPFTRLDLVTCRNLLIYLEGDLQKRLLEMFHYALNPGGVLALGSSETTVNAAGLFAPLPGAGKCRIYRRQDSSAGSLHGGFFSGPARRGAAAKPAVPQSGAQAQAEALLLKRYCPPAVLTTDKGDIVYISGRTGKYLEPAAGKATLNLFRMTREALAPAVNEAFARALRRGTAVTLSVEEGEDPVEITVQPLEEPEALRGLVLTVFSEGRPGPAPRRGAAGREARLAALAEELRRSREELRATLEEVRSSQEELTSSNEELQSANEELQSVNEELNISKEELQALNERYRSFIETTNDGIWEADAECRYVYVSPQLEKMLGYGRGDLLGRRPFDLMPQEEAERLKGVFCAGRAKGQPLRALEHLKRRRDGGLLALETNAMPLLDEEGRPRGYWGMDRDISERRRLEEERFALLDIMQRSLNEIYLFDAETLRFEYVNRGVTLNLGYTMEELLDMTAVDIKPSFTREAFRELLAPLLAGEKEKLVFETEHRRKDGSLYPVEVHLQLTARAGRRKFLAVILDITQRRRAEETLKAALEKLRFHLSNTPMAAIEFDSEYRITGWSGRAEAIFGWKAEEVLGKRIGDFRWVHEEDVSGVAALSAEMLAATPGANVHVNRNYRKDGSLLTCEWYNSVLPSASDGKFSVFSLVLDVTERKRAEEGMLASLGEKEVLLKEIHHRVKNNLQVVSSLLNLQAKRVNDEGALAALRESRARVGAMALVHETLYKTQNFSRLEMRDYVSRLAGALLEINKAAGRVAFKSDVCDCRLSTDIAVSIGLILNELISNAFKHAFPAGREGKLKVELKWAGDAYLLAVEDDGPGLPAGFELEKSGSLGLQLVASLARQISGSAAAAPARGGRFEVRFPG